MNHQHMELAAGRWLELDFVEQLANVGSEVERAILWRTKGNSDYAGRALERALELLGLTVADKKNKRRLRELTRMREALLDYFYADNRYSSSDSLWQSYFNGFAYAARRHK